MNELMNIVIEELIARNFEEAYAVDFFKQGRVRDFFQSKLDDLDWEKIEKKVKEIRDILEYDHL